MPHYKVPGLYFIPPPLKLNLNNKVKRFIVQNGVYVSIGGNTMIILDRCVIKNTPPLVCNLLIIN